MRAAAYAMLVLLVCASLAGCLGPGAEDDLFNFGRKGTPAEVAASPQGLTVDKQPFLVRGVVYSPVPPGVEPSTAEGYWDWVAHPDIYQTDFRLMKRMGVNTFRVIDMPGDCRVVRPMLDAAQTYDLKVIAGLRGPMGKDSAQASVRQFTLERVADVARCVRDHPATLMYLVGNEVDLDYKGADVGDWYRLLEESARLLHRMDAHHPVATANNALTHAKQFVELAPSVDVYATNMYAVKPETWRDWLYPTYHALVPNKPLLISEFGMDAWDSRANREDPALQAALITMAWREIESQAKGGFRQSAGGCLFEWSDEWWKAGNTKVHEGTPGWSPHDGKGVLPDNAFSEEYFGIVAVDASDPLARVPREAYYSLQKLWALPGVQVPPSIVNVRSGIVHGDTVHVVADVVPFGPGNASVKVRYRVNAAPQEDEPMVRTSGDTYAADLGPFGGVNAVFYQIVARDAAGRVRVSQEYTARIAATGASGTLSPVAQLLDGAGRAIGDLFAAVGAALGLGPAPSAAKQDAPPPARVAAAFPTASLLAAMPDDLVRDLVSLAQAAFDRFLQVFDWVSTRPGSPLEQQGAALLLVGGLATLGLLMSMMLFQSFLGPAPVEFHSRGPRRSLLPWPTAAPVAAGVGAPAGEWAGAPRGEQPREAQRRGRAAGRRVASEDVDAVLDRVAASRLGDPRVLRRTGNLLVVRLYGCRACAGEDSGKAPGGEAGCSFERGFLEGAFTKALGDEVVVREVTCRAVAPQQADGCEFEVWHG